MPSRIFAAGKKKIIKVRPQTSLTLRPRLVISRRTETKAPSKEKRSFRCSAAAGGLKCRPARCERPSTCPVDTAQAAAAAAVG